MRGSGSSRLRELAVPLFLLATLAALLLPLPPVLLDLLLVGQLLIALLLLGSALYLADPLSLSALPSMLLLTTIYRLALNVSTTRLILGGAETGQMIEGFGTVVIGGSLVVGACVFLIITLVQFIVIAKGSERVAEVAARFTLDALPGKQMSIDADLRSGLLSTAEAREKRQSLQIESRFYGALDGAMKFIKGDAIAGMLITGINIVGGLAVGVLLHQLELSEALSRYTLLTVGDGLLSQIPAVLNSLAAGMIVTRVTRGDGQSLAAEVYRQLLQSRRAQVLGGATVLILAVLPGLPSLPLLSGAALILILSVSAGSAAEAPPSLNPVFRPKLPPLIAIGLGQNVVVQIAQQGEAGEVVRAFQERVHRRWGLLVPQPELLPLAAADSYQITVRGVAATSVLGVAPTGETLGQILEQLEQLIGKNPQELLDDIMTRRLLDQLELEAPELVATIVPEIVTVTQLSEVLKALLEEAVPIANLDVILQAVAENKPKVGEGRRLVAETRAALKRLISAQFSCEGVLAVVGVDPLIDLALAKAEQGGTTPPWEYLELIAEQLKAASVRTILLSKGARRLLWDGLTMRGLQVTALAYEEISGVELRELERVVVPADKQEDLLDALAA